MFQPWEYVNLVDESDGGEPHYVVYDEDGNEFYGSNENCKYDLSTFGGIIRYTRAVGERKCIEICPAIWLIDEPKNATYIEIITEKEPDSDINRPNNAIYRPNNAQSKVKESKGKERIIYPYQEVADYWNEHFTSFPKVIKLNDTRRIKIGQRLNEMGLDTWRETMHTLCERMQASPFLRGETTDWKASFDWLMANPTNWIKVVEGNYQNNKSKKMAEQANDTIALEKWQRIQKSDEN